MNDRQRKKILSYNDATCAVSRCGRHVSTFLLLALLLALTACARGGVAPSAFGDASATESDPFTPLRAIAAFTRSEAAAPSAFGGGSGTKGDPYLISTEAHLRDIAAAPQLYEGKHFLQTADIRLNGLWRPIGHPSTFREGEFSGRFDGNGHKITGLMLRTPLAALGLFGMIRFDGEVRNLIVETSPEGISINDYDARAGIIAGYNSGVIENCVARGRLAGGGVLGGIVGLNVGTVKNCTNYASIEAHAEGTQSAGGIAGINSGLNNLFIRRGDGPEPSRKALLSRCTNHGPVTAAGTFASCAGGITSQTTRSLVEDCSNSGPVLAEGGSYETVAGGIVGDISSLSEIFRCLNTGTVNASGRKRITVAGGVAGKDWYKVVTTDSRSTVKATVKEEKPSRQGEP